MPRIKTKTGEIKPALNVQVHADIRMMAGLHLTMKSIGVQVPPKPSTLINTALEILIEAWRKAGMFKEVLQIHQAVQVLEQSGYRLDQAYKRSPDITASLVAENRLAEILAEIQAAPAVPIEALGTLPPEAIQAIEKERERKQLAALQAPEIVFEGQMPAPAPTREEELEALRRMREKLGLAAPPSDTE
jgi:hypothetical protein